jgi:acyl-CoA dehydrogenase
MVEELAKADLSGFAVPVGLLSPFVANLVAKGDEQLKEEVLPNVVKKGWIMGLHSTEPGCGTDFTRITTIADKADGEYVVNGEKQCVSLVLEARKFGGGFVTSVNTDPEFRQRAKGMSLLYIPANANGITVTTFTGMGVDLAGVKYDGTRVPQHCLIGGEGMGALLLHEFFSCSRVPVTMSMIAPTERILEAGMEYIKQRKAFKRPIGAFEGIQFELAEDYARVQAAKWMCYRAAWMVDRYLGGKTRLEDAMLASSMAKLIASDDCMKAVSDVLEWFGGIGTTTEYPIARAFSSLRQVPIAEGTRHAQKLVVALSLLGTEFAPWRKWE